MNAKSGRRIWILGGTSAIALAYARLRAAEGASLLLAGRNAEHLKANATDLIARGAPETAAEVLDLASGTDHAAAVDGFIQRHGFPDEVVVAYGILGDQSEALADLAHARAVIEANYTSVALWLIAIRARRDEAKPLSLVVIGSVAGDRGRGSNFVYGSAKGGLDRFLQGLQHANARTSLHVLRVKPGFVDTPMTAAIPKGGFLWARPEQVARDMARAVDRRASVVYTPWFWRYIMLVIRLLPAFLFNRVEI